MASKRKTTTKAAAKPKPTKAKKEKKTVEQLTDDQRKALLFQHKRKIAPLIEAKKDATTALSKAFAFAADEGIPKVEIEMAILLETPEGEEKLKKRTEATLRVAHWVGVKLGSQLDLFGKTSNAERIFQMGQRAAFNDEPAKPPAYLSQKDAQHWLEGHADGRCTLNVQRSAGFKRLADVAQQVAIPLSGAPPEEPAAPSEPALTH
jgi:hypothetical protein